MKIKGNDGAAGRDQPNALTRESNPGKPVDEKSRPIVETLLGNQTEEEAIERVFRPDKRKATLFPGQDMSQAKVPIQNILIEQNGRGLLPPPNENSKASGVKRHSKEGDDTTPPEAKASRK